MTSLWTSLSPPSLFSTPASMPEILIPSSDYFVMGDHRSISSDSRDFGPVDRDLSSTAKPPSIYWPADNMGVVR